MASLLSSQGNWWVALVSWHRLCAVMHIVLLGWRIRHRRGFARVKRETSVGNRWWMNAFRFGCLYYAVHKHNWRNPRVRGRACRDTIFCWKVWNWNCPFFKSVALMSGIVEPQKRTEDSLSLATSDCRESRLKALLRNSTVCGRNYRNLWEIPLCVEVTILRPVHVTSRTHLAMKFEQCHCQTALLAANRTPKLTLQPAPLGLWYR